MALLALRKCFVQSAYNIHVDTDIRYACFSAKEHSHPDTGRRWDCAVGSADKSNKKSVKTSHEALSQSMACDASSIQLVGTIVHIFRKEKRHISLTDGMETG